MQMLIVSMTDRHADLRVSSSKHFAIVQPESQHGKAIVAKYHYTHYLNLLTVPNFSDKDI